MSNYFYVSDDNPDGAMIAKSASKKVGFFGATPVIQQDDCTAITLSTVASSYLTDATAMKIAINQMRDTLNNLGLTA